MAGSCAACFSCQETYFHSTACPPSFIWIWIELTIHILAIQPLYHLSHYCTDQFTPHHLLQYHSDCRFARSSPRHLFHDLSFSTDSCAGYGIILGTCSYLPMVTLMLMLSTNTNGLSHFRSQDIIYYLFHMSVNLV